MAAVRGKGIPASYGGGGGWRVGWKTSLVAVPRYSAFRSEGTKPIRPEGGAHAGIVEDHRPWLGSRPGPGGRPEGLRRAPPGVVQGKAAVFMFNGFKTG